MFSHQAYVDFLYLWYPLIQIVKGLGETLVGAYSGRALSFSAKKSNTGSPKVVYFFIYESWPFTKLLVLFFFCRFLDSQVRELGFSLGGHLYLDRILMERIWKGMQELVFMTGH